ncbi:MAG TPA: bifunctional ornithine acetyltransferase/N-acetylglutamate synthase, partial [Candidatus Melainabacteria bacterium]|nr:bifunctional ornithine acetyltransferase/N-acetylglutamate synthase [Candidatus Melainabacteria bacterium]
MKATIRTINGGVTSAQGFQAAGAHVGLKRKRKDLAIVVSDCPAVMAGTFTQNTAKAPPVLWNHNINQKGEPVKALVINS